MKKFKGILLAVVAVMAIAAPAQAKFRFGIRGGLTFNELSFSEEAINQVQDAGNQTGWTAGITTEFTVPILNIGFDVSALYTHHVLSYTSTDASSSTVAGAVTTEKPSFDFIEVPIHVRYKLALPVLEKVMIPLIFTGPNFAFRVSDKIIDDVKAKSCQTSWDLGAGIELFKRLQVTGTYSWGLNDFVEYTKNVNSNANNIPNEYVGKSNGWTITASIFF